jgi:AcrR family transcriptional regulator
VDDHAVRASLAVDAFGLPEVPGPNLDPYLDAAARCFARHGLRRTKVVDNAEEAGVSRVTVYRQVGDVDLAARLLLARELDRLLSTLLPRVAEVGHPDEVVAVIADAIRFAIDHPVLAKVLRDEAELVGGFLVTELDVLLGRLRVLATPILDQLVRLGGPPEIDVVSLVDCVARVAVTLVLSPPPGDVEAYLAVLLRPLLAAAPDPTGPQRRRALRPSPPT